MTEMTNLIKKDKMATLAWPRVYSADDLLLNRGNWSGNTEILDSIYHEQRIHDVSNVYMLQFLTYAAQQIGRSGSMHE